MFQGRAGVGSESTCQGSSGLPTLTAAVKMIGAVSPAARPMLMTMPVRIPGSAAGRITVRMVRQWPAPSASAASL